MKKIYKIGLLGCGTIGSAVAEELLSGNHPELVLKKVLVKDTSKKRSIPLDLLVSSSNELTQDPEIDIVVEVMGNEEPALTYVLEALKNKKHLVTANKELMAKHGPKIFEEASKAGVLVRLDATVGGGIPIINTILDSLKANKISQVVGILNGTTNYILTEMKEGAEFADALRGAQEKGYAEPDPTNDLDGIDAKYKISILASLAFRQYIHPDKVKNEGIKNISSADFRFARELGYSIKLLGAASSKEDKVSVSVYPALIKNNKSLARIDGVLNSIMVRGHLINELLLVGPGAGPKPTTSAILGDVLTIIRSQGETSLLPYTVSSSITLQESNEFRFYVRLRVFDRIGVIKDLGTILADYNISLESIVQKLHSEGSSWDDDGEATLIILTHKVEESVMLKVLDEIRKLGQIKEICSVLRVFE
jgi:homoserine dehydrogenase